MEVIASTLSDNEYVDTQDLKTTYEIWNKLKTIYGGDPHELRSLGTVNVTLDSLIGHIASRCPKNDMKDDFRRYKEKRKECYFAEGVTDEESKGSDGEGIAFVAVKEDNTKESDIALISNSNRCGDWVIDSGYTHHMIGDRNKFLNMEDCDGGLVRFGNDVPCAVKDDFSRMMWAVFLKEKSEAFHIFKVFKARVERGTGKSLKCLSSDGGGEFTFQEFKNYYEEQEIMRQMSAPKIPQQNGVAERRNITLIDCTRTLMIQKDIPHVL
ncbi:hypothetical protein SUGI_0058660 [Cryptomeria japonica]|nr:hypothetical protein SUGI_0058660 [Cryptomeria japonica]